MRATALLYLSNLVGLALGLSSGCATSSPESCSTSDSGSCCFESPGGYLSQPQFWDTNPVTGPSDSWTIHGLWPNDCNDSGYPQSCDPSRDYTDIRTLLDDNGAADTIEFMDDYWVNDDGTNDDFWAHEWSKHGTCLSTLQTSCLPQSSPPGLEAVAYFQTVVKLFKTLPTYDWLSAAGITPSESATYTLSQITDALSGSAGAVPSVSCTKGALGGVSYYFYLDGSIIDGTFVPVDAPSGGNCPKSGIKYLPKSE